MPSIQSRLTAALADRYRVERELGAGGMATVYLAHDLRHERDVAIKVLHPDLGAALGSERFLAEIRVTARLQHPHILPLLDSGEADGLLFYVMPFVRGETLRTRLEREQQLPVEDALRIAREVAGALDHAHGTGVVHRDIKPENILLQDGHALVADFGIALAVQQAGGQRMTQTGLSLGTPQYMSPEQAMGDRVVDARTDVYALAAVTYEMLVGEPPFTGANAQAIVAKVLTAPPPSARADRASVPSAVDAALARGLAKLPADRFGSAGALVQTFTVRDGALHGAAHGEHPAEGSRARRSAPLVAIGVVGAVVGAVAGALLVSGRLTGGPSDAPVPAPIVRVVVPEPVGVSRSTTVLGDLLPDGSGMVQIGDGPGGHGLFVQSFTDTIARFLPFPDAAVGTVPIPDGTGFLTYSFTRSGLSRLNLVPASGGPVRPLTDSVRFGLILDAEGRVHGSHHSSGALVRMGADGNALSVLATPDDAKGELAYRLPYPVGDAGFLILITYRDGRPSQVGVYDAKANAVRALTPGGSPRLLAPGLIVYTVDNGTVMAARFDEERLALVGTPVPVWRDPAIPGYVSISVSRDGSLLYPQRLFGTWSVVRVGGARVDTVFSGAGVPPEAVFTNATGTRFALDLPGAIEMRDPQGGIRRITTGGGARLLQWVPGSERLLLLQRRAARSGPSAPRENRAGWYVTPGQLLTLGGDLGEAPTPFSPSGGVADTGTVGAALGPSGWVEETRRGALRYHEENGRSAISLGSGKFPQVSPDGAYVAYEDFGPSGATQVMVAALPPRTGKWEVGPGSRPRWSPDGRWLYFAGAQRPYSAVTLPVSRVPVSTTTGFAVGTPELVADPPANATQGWAVGPTNGLVYWITSEERTQPILVTNFARLADSLLTAAGVRR